MSNLTPSLRFDFTSTYSTKSNGGSNHIKVKDISGNGYDGTLTTGCSITNDPIMGPCMSFDGTSGYITIPPLTSPGNGDFSQEFTMCAWVNFASFGTLSSIIDLGKSSDHDNLILHLSGDKGAFELSHLSSTGTTHRFTLPTPSQEHIKKNVNVLETGKWAHIAVTVDSTGIGRIYINGIRVYKTPDADMEFLPNKNVTTFNNYIGGSNWRTGTVNRFHGKMAWVSLYNTKLSTDQINEDMIEGESNRTVTFRKSLPIDFQVYSKSNNDNAPVLYIEQAGDGQDFYLEITNNTASPISIPVAQGEDKASESKYHFQLHFRPGTLSKNLFGPAQTIGNWSVAIGSDAASNEEYISFLCTSTVDAIAATNGSLLLKVPKVSANALGGARNTNVSFLYSLGNALKGQRMQSLSIVNHSGQKDIPLHVDVVGAPQVLNDGSSENDLLFRIENIGAEPIPLSKTASNTTKKSIFEVGVMVQPLGEMMEWALVKQEDVSSLALDWPVIGVVASSTASGATFSITLEEPLAATLLSGSKIIVKPTSGVAGIYTLTSAANAGQREIATNSTTSIGGGAIVSLSSNLGTLSASTSTALTLNTALPFKIASRTALTIAPPADVIAQAKSWDSSTNTLTLNQKHSLPAGRKIYLVTHVGKAKESVIKATAVSLLTPHTGSIDPGTPLSIVTPTGEEHNAQTTGPNSTGTILTVTNPLTIPQDSVISYHQLLGTVKTATTNAKTLVLIPSGSITVSENSLLVIKPASDTVLSVTTSGKSKESHTSINITASETVQVGSILSLASATSPWKVLENSLVTSAISGLQQWTITNEQVEEIVSGGSIEFLLRDIVCGLPTGQSLITIRYYNIPGYWDGKFVIPIQKSPIVSRGQRVGIGTNAPTAMLDVAGEIKASKLTTTGTISAGTAEIKTTGNVSTDTLTATGDITTTTGKVGIETDAPFSTLHVIDPGGPTRDNDMKHGIIVSNGTNGGAINLGISNGNNGQTSTSFKKLPNDVAFIQSAYVNNGQKANLLALNPYGSDVSIGDYIKAGKGSANLDVNGTTTSKKLTVNGTTTSKELIVKGTTTSKELTVNDTITSKNLDIKGIAYLGHANCADILPEYPEGAVGSLAVAWNKLGQGEVDLYNTYDNGGVAFQFMQLTQTDDSPKVTSEGNLMTIMESGNVGIGITKPIYPLHVDTGVKPGTQPSGRYFAGNTAMAELAKYNLHAAFSIVATDGILAELFVAKSDERIKDNLRLSDSVADLQILMRLKLTDYEYRDKVNKGNRPTKGLIAQELEEVLPQAVHKSIGFIPNIYAHASKIKHSKKKKELTITLKKKHKLKKGDLLKLITEDNQEVEKEVKKVLAPYTLVVKNWTEKTNKLFVYGKQVDDLKGIDYHQVAMLGISATQQLHKELEATKVENKTLRKESKQLKKQFDTEMGELRAELEAIKNLISTPK